MKKILLIIMILFIAFGSFAKGDFDKVNTIYSNIPVKIMFKQDTTFNVILDKYDEKYIHYEVINDTILKITHKGFWIDMHEGTPIVKIETPRALNIECPRYLRISE